LSSPVYGKSRSKCPVGNFSYPRKAVVDGPSQGEETALAVVPVFIDSILQLQAGMPVGREGTGLFEVSNWKKF
jgi:hypothetical protein